MTILETTFYLYMFEEYGYDEAKVGRVVRSDGTIGRAGAGGGVGKISAAIGDRRMTGLGAVLLGVGLGVATLYEVLWFLLVFLGVAAIGRALLQPGGMALMSGLAPTEAETGKVMGVMQSAQSMGRIIGPLIGGLSCSTPSRLVHHLSGRDAS